MTDQATRIVPAGWYEDPASTAHVRWWNGLAWTEHTTLKPTAPPTPLAAEPVVVTTSTGTVHTAETLARIAEARELERQYGISTDEHDIIVRSATEGAAADGSRRAAQEASAAGSTTGTTAGAVSEAQPLSRRALRGTDAVVYTDEGTSTASAWFIALWPLLTLVAAVAAAYVAFYVSPEPSVAGIPVVAGLVVVPLLLVLIWAATDARRLRSRGLRPASPAFALLGPLVYLIARRARVSGSGPLVTLILLTLAVVGGPVAAYATGAAVPVTKALEIQQTVRADYVESGRLASVNCPIFVESVAQGAIYSCEGVNPDGTSQRIWVSIEDAEGGFDYALDVR